MQHPYPPRTSLIVLLTLCLGVTVGWFVQARLTLAQGPALVPQRERDRDRGRGPRVPGGEVVAGESMLVLTSRDRTTVWAYSKHHGVWKRLPLPAPLPPNVSPIVSELVVVVQFGNDVHAFSGRTGGWDRTRLEAPGEVVIHSDWAYVVGGPRIHAFSAHSGKWESLDPSTK